MIRRNQCTARWLLGLGLFWVLVVLWPSVTGQAVTQEEDLRQAKTGDVRTQLKLGQEYYEGKNRAQDYHAAMHWFRLAAAQGNAQAQNSVGTLYDNGKGVPKDYQEAAKWFRLAAAQGHVLARRNLGWMYEKGQGFAKNVVLAYMWHYLAEMARVGRTTGIQCQLCSKMASKMTQEQIAQAQALARNWRPETDDLVD